MILSIVLGLFIFTGCSLQNGPGDSSTATLNIDGEWYDALGKEKTMKYTIDEEVGKIKKTVSPKDTTPSGNLESNYLEAGTPIFSSKEDKNIILAEIKEGRYQIFEKRYKDKYK